jgi:hypothetical protein
MAELPNDLIERLAGGQTFSDVTTELERDL